MVRQQAELQASEDEFDAALLQGEFIRLLDRMSRRLLDVVRIEMLRLNIHDINAAQAVMLLNIGQDELSVRDLMSRGYYLGTNASYCLKNLAEGGYIERSISMRDRRAAIIKLSDKGRKVCDVLRRIDHGRIPGVEQAYRTMLEVERSWSDHLRSNFGIV